MFTPVVHRNGSGLQIAGYIIRTLGPNETEAIIFDLEGRFPLNLYEALRRVHQGSMYQEVVMFSLPRQVGVPVMDVTPYERDGETWTQIVWSTTPDRKSTTFDMHLRITEVANILQYMKEIMTSDMPLR